MSTARKRKRLANLQPITLAKYRDMARFFDSLYEQRNAAGRRVRYEDALQLTAVRFYCKPEHVQYVLRTVSRIESESQSPGLPPPPPSPPNSAQ